MWGSVGEVVGRVYGVNEEGAGKCVRRCGKVWGETFFRKMSWSALQYQHRSCSAVNCCNSKLITNAFPQPPHFPIPLPILRNT